MKTKSLFMLAVLAILATVGFTSCDELAVEDNPMQSYLTMRTSDVTLTEGETYVRKAVAAGTAVVVYSSSDATVATVDQEGKVTAIAAGTATITAQTTGYYAEGKKIYLAEEKSYKVTVKPATLPAAAWAANEYNEASWDGTKVVFTKKTAASEPTALTNSVTSWSGWYTVSGNVTITGDVTLGADTHLILQDGAKLNCQRIDFSNTSGYTLYIYGQDKRDGKLNISNSSATALWGSNQGEIVIHGGEITAESTPGRGLYAKGIKVYGGKLTATSTGSGGIMFFAGNFEVYGGEVEGESTYYAGSAISSSSSNTLIVYGGKVKATGGASANGFSCKLLSGTSGIKFYFSTDGTTWGSGTNYGIAATAPVNRYAKAE